MTLFASSQLRADPPRPSRMGIVQFLQALVPSLGTSNEPVLAGGAGRFYLIESKTASGDATIDFTTLSADYHSFILYGDSVVPATDNVSAWIRLSVASTFQTANYYYSLVLSRASPAAVSQIGAVSQSQIVIATNVGSDTGEHINFEATLFNPANTALYKGIKVDTDGLQNGAEEAAWLARGRYRGGTGAIDGIRFMFSSGNIESGNFYLYGIAAA